MTFKAAGISDNILSPSITPESGVPRTAPCVMHLLRSARSHGKGNGSLHIRAGGGVASARCSWRGATTRLVSRRREREVAAGWLPIGATCG